MSYKTVINTQGAIYKIVRDIDLGGENFSMPANCTLDFQGGKIINGTLTLNNTKVLPNGCVITDYIQSSISGTYAKGQQLYDITLNKPIWWTGSAWVDATGATV